MKTDWVRIKDIPSTFGIGKTKASQLMQEMKSCGKFKGGVDSVSYTHLRAHETN